MGNGFFQYNLFTGFEAWLAFESWIVLQNIANVGLEQMTVVVFVAEF